MFPLPDQKVTSIGSITDFMTYSEFPTFIRNDHYGLFGVLHEPLTRTDEGKQEPESVGIIFCNPFAEENLIGHRVMVTMARYLAKHGVFVLRFNYMGNGDSEGDFSETSIESGTCDIEKAVEFLRQRANVSKVGLLGVRFGATLAALTLKGKPAVDFLILVNPIIKGDRYVDECLRSNLATQLAVFGKITKTREQLVLDLLNGNTVNVDGYLVGKQLYQEMIAVDLIGAASKIPKHVKILMLQLAKNGRKGKNTEIEGLKTAYDQIGIQAKLSFFENGNFWLESKVYNPEYPNLYHEISNWIQQHV